MKASKLISIFVAMAFIGCASAPISPGPGDKPDPVPPKIVSDKDGDKWDRPAAFGPVPDNLKGTGDRVCSPFGMKAIGYHPKAQDKNGKEYKGGAYLCSNHEYLSK